MSQDFQVQYNILVNAEPALKAINTFKQSVASLNKTAKSLNETTAAFHRIGQAASLFKNPINITVSVKGKNKVKTLADNLQRARREALKLKSALVSLGAVKGPNPYVPVPGGGGRSNSAGGKIPSGGVVAGGSRIQQNRMAQTPVMQPSNLSYKLLGANTLPNNGGLAVGMLQGMGIAYGISGLGTLISQIVKEASEFDNTMKTVQNILQSHDTRANFGEKFAQMSQVIRDVGKETKYTTGEVSDAAKFLAMAGLNVDAISTTMRPIADVALIGDTKLGETADLMTNVMTGYNIDPKKMRETADAMTNTFTMTNTTLIDIAEAYKYAGSILSSGGMQFEESAAAIGVLGDAGIKGSQAGTTLRTMFANILNPTKKQAEAWAEAGVSTTDKSGKRKDVLQIFKELSAKDLDVSMYYRLFHKTAATGAVALANHVDKWEDVYLENLVAGGISAKLADEKKKTIEGLWAQLTSVFVDNGVEAFNGVQGNIRQMMEKVIDWLDTPAVKEGFKEVAKDLMEFVSILKDATVTFGSLFKVFKPFLLVWMKFQLIITPFVKTAMAIQSVFRLFMGFRNVALGLGSLTSYFHNFKMALMGVNAAASQSVLMNGTASAGGVGAALRNATVSGGLVASQDIMGQAPRSFWWNQSTIGGGRYRFFGQKAYQWQPFKRWGKDWRPFGWTNKIGFNTGKPFEQWKNEFINQYGFPQDYAMKHMNDPNMNREKAIKQYHKLLQDKYDQYKGYQARRFARSQAFGNIAGGAAGMAGIGYGMYKLTDTEGTGYGKVSGGLYSVAGIAAQAGGAWGWGIAAAAGIAGAIFDYFDRQATSKRILDELTKDLDLHKYSNGVLSNSESTILQYLELQRSKHLSINDLVNKRIELTSRLLGLASSENPADASTGVGKTMREKMEEMDAHDLQTFFKNAQESLSLNEDLLVASGLKRKGRRGLYTTTSEAQATLTGLAEVYSDGGYYSKLLEGFQMTVSKNGLKGTPYAEIEKYINEIDNGNNPLLLKGLYDWRDNPNPDSNDLKDILNNRFIRQDGYDKLLPLLNDYRQSYKTFDEQKASGKFTEGGIMNFMRHVINGQAGGFALNYNPNNIAQTFAGYGFSDGAFHSKLIEDKRTGKVELKSAEEMSQIAISDIEAFQKTVKQLGLDTNPAIEAVMQLSNVLLTEAQKMSVACDDFAVHVKEGYVNDILYKYNEVLDLYEAYDKDGNKILTFEQQTNQFFDSMGKIKESMNFDWGKAGSEISNYLLKMANPQQSIQSFAEYQDETTSKFDGTGRGLLVNTKTSKAPFEDFIPKPTTTFQPQLEKNQFNAMTKQEDKNKNGGGGSGTSSSDYKHTKKSGVTPKQININIENLMNVSKLDLTGPDKQAVVQDLKEQLATALYEAAGDGVLMLNQLA